MSHCVRCTGRPAAAAAMVLAAITLGSVIGLVVLNARAASLCPSTYGHTCDHRVPIWSTGGVGFSTDGAPCNVPGDGDHAILISSSATEPHVNQGPITDDSLYLWAWSRVLYGYGYWDTSTGFVGDIPLTAFEATYPAFAYGFDGHNLHWQLCIDDGYRLVGRLVVAQPTAVEPQPWATWGRMKALYR